MSTGKVTDEDGAVVSKLKLIAADVVEFPAESMV